MSGFFGIIHLDGQPVDRSAAERMLERIHYRGPDNQNLKIDGSVAFGHTLFALSRADTAEIQPLTLQDITITGRFLLVARDEMVDKLKRAGQPASLQSPDVELALYAYLVYGRDCLQHLFGEFSFGIWDKERGQFLGACDQMGVVPFYYAINDKTLVFSNEMGALCLHPSVSPRYNDQAVGDFLLTGIPTWIDKTNTIYADIHRLSSAHCLSADAGGIKIQRYWELATHHPMLRYSDEQTYVDQFRALFKTVIKDRLRADKTVITMSGGMDSTSLAAMAHELVSEGTINTELQIVTTVYDRIHPDTEAYFAGLTARKLGIPIHYFEADHYLLTDPIAVAAEPAEDYQSGMLDAAGRLVAQHGRIALSGHSADEVLLETPLYEALRGLPLTEAAELFFWLWRFMGKRPPLAGSQILTAKLKNPRLWFKQANNPIYNPNYGYPVWLNPDFEKEMHLKERWVQFWQPRSTKNSHRIHVWAYNRLVKPNWQHTREKVEVMDYTPTIATTPFLDLRLINFVLSLPPLPWQKKKYILRQAMRNTLPIEVIRRPKTAIGTVLTSLLRQPGVEWVDHWESDPDLSAYINRQAVPLIVGRDMSPPDEYVNVRPLLFNGWLKKVREVRSTVAIR